MTRLIEVMTERLHRPQVERLFEELVPRDAQVVVGGPGESPEYDAGLLWASSWVTDGGTVWIADPQSTGPNQRHELAYDARYVLGTGDVAEYERYLIVAKVAGLPLSKVEWLGRQSTLWQMPGIANESVDIVMDHYTSTFLLRGLAFIPPTKLLPDILAEYRRILKPGGKVLFQTDRKLRVDGLFRIQEGMSDALVQSGFSVSHHAVRDRLPIRMSEEVYQHLVWMSMDYLRPETAKIASAFFKHVRKMGTPPILLFKPYYVCPDLYVATKRNE